MPSYRQEKSPACAGLTRVGDLPKSSGNWRLEQVRHVADCVADFSSNRIIRVNANAHALKADGRLDVHGVNKIRLTCGAVRTGVKEQPNASTFLARQHNVVEHPLTQGVIIAGEKHRDSART